MSQSRHVCLSFGCSSKAAATQRLNQYDDMGHGYNVFNYTCTFTVWWVNQDMCAWALAAIARQRYNKVPLYLFFKHFFSFFFFFFFPIFSFFFYSLTDMCCWYICYGMFNILCIVKRITPIWPTLQTPDKYRGRRLYSQWFTGFRPMYSWTPCTFNDLLQL